MKSKKSRRGILLLLILALLAMFGMVVVAFVVLSSQSMRSTKVGSGHERIYHPPANDTTEAAMMALRGTLNPVSKVRYHSLFEDMYGARALSTLSNAAGTPLTIVGATAVCGGQLTEININYGTLAQNPNRDTDIAEMKRRIGSVLTITTKSSLAGGLSTRIVGFNTANANPQIVGPMAILNLHIVAFPNIAPANVNLNIAAGGLVGSNFVVNDMPFSGTGFGYNSSSGSMSMASLRPFALNDNPIFGDLLGGAHEDYDAVDLQNMLLATPPIGNRIIPSLHRPALVNYTYWNLIYPMLSNFATEEDKWRFIFHPVDVYNSTTYNSTIVPPTTTPATSKEQMVYAVVSAKRPIIGRPLTDEHPSFNGSNLTSLASYYDNTANRPFAWESGEIPHWDVDTDGDGIPDAIWIDIGLPVRMTLDGRKYKPLVAYYVLDLDGRLNLNAHGSLAQTSQDYYTQTHAVANPLFPDRGAEWFAGAQLPQAAAVTYPARGRGFGPAEINFFNPTLANNSILPIAYPDGLNPPINFYHRLLSGLTDGAGNILVEGRYGFDTVPGDCVNGLPKVFTGLQPAVVEQRKYNDYLSANKWYEFDGLRDSVSGLGALNANAAANVAGVSGLPVESEMPDPSGKGILGLDPIGRPIIQSIDSTTWYNTPYELNLGLSTSRGLPTTAMADSPPDNPFSVNELERILRPFDRDMQSQSTRLAALTAIPGTNKSVLNFDPGNLNRNYREHEITTESWDVPVYSAGLPDYILQYMRTDAGHGISTMVAYRMANGLPIDRPVPDWIKPKKITDVLKAYLYYELCHAPYNLPAEDDPSDPNIKGAHTISDQLVDNLAPADLLSLFPPELLAGLKMNVNHAFPGAADVANNRNFDLAVLWQNSGIGGNYGQIWFGKMPNTPFPDPNSTIISPNAPFAARQLYARYLYILALLLREPGKTAQLLPTTSTLTAAEKEEITKRRIAQWAINVACYKVNDSIMVPFEYHADPFRIYEDTSTTPHTYRLVGWSYLDTSATPPWKNLDGRVSWYDSSGNLINPDGSATDDTQPDRRLVWGCKPPEAILTETLAVHNRRIADTNWEKVGGTKVDPSDPNADKDYDQVRIPQGSAFFEIYACRDLHGAIPPPDLYNQAGQLNLGKLAPADNTPGHVVPSYPVWRMVISESRFVPLPKQAWHNDVRDRLMLPKPLLYTLPTDLERTPDTASIEPEQFYGELATLQNGTLNPNNVDRMRFSMLPNAPISKVGLDRIVWFANMEPTAQHRDWDRVFWNRSTPGSGTEVPLPRGRYAVVGPRAFTRFGLTNDTTSDADYPLGTLANQTITMTSDVNLDSPNNLVSVTTIDGTLDTNSVTAGPATNTDKVKLPVAIVAAGGGPGTNWPIGWTQTATTAPTGIGVNISEPLFSSPAGYYPEPTVAATWPAPDNVMEWYGDPRMQDTNKYFIYPPQDTIAGKPLADETVDGVAGHELAKFTGTFPNYKTVFLQRLANPSAPYDPLTNPYLTVDWMPIDLTVFTGDDVAADPAKDPSDFADSAAVNVWTRFATRQRGINMRSGRLQRDPNSNVWFPLSDEPDPRSQSAPTTGATPYFDYDLFTTRHHSLGYLNWAYWNTADLANQWITQGNLGTRPLEFIGDPLTTTTMPPFPWMPWFGRPYVSEMELMLVPTSSAARLLWEFEPCKAVDRTASPPDYYVPKSAAKPEFYAPDGSNCAFPQLPNFLQQSGGTTMPLYPLLDYVGVPSWYAGTEIQANPTSANNNKAPVALVPGDYHWFGTPYNRISNYREPGRVNLNTIFYQDVFAGLMNSVPNPGPDDFVRSRRGYGSTGNIFEPCLPSDPHYPCPTEFRTPFRSSSGAAWSLNVSGPPADPIQTTLLRQNPATPADPLFQKSTSVADVENPYRNPYFLYSDLMRMGNLTTTRSNVYAMWVTVGYFEVAPAVPPSRTGSVTDSWMYRLSQQANQPSLQALMHEAYPDGYQLGQELGSDTGKITRHRAFYIIDRSIPVGFQRGQDLNVEKAILLKRNIE